MPRYSLDSVTIDGFRGLRNLRLDDMGLINILVGPNNCGKTSVLEAVSILCDPTNPDEWMEMVTRRDFGRLDESRIRSFRWCFGQPEVVAELHAPFAGRCEMSCGGRFPVRKLKVEYRDFAHTLDREEIYAVEEVNKVVGMLSRATVRRSNLPDDPGSLVAEFTHHIERGPAEGSFATAGEETIIFRHWEDMDLIRMPNSNRERIKTESLTPYSYQTNQKQVVSLSKQSLSVSSDERWALDLARRFDGDIEDVSVESLDGRRPSIYLKHRKLGYAPLSVFGDAIRRAVLLANTLPTLRDGGILLLDEVETGIHVGKTDRVFAWLIEAARALKVQILATTHSLEAIDGFVTAEGNKVDDIVSYRLTQAEDETKVRRLAGDLLLRIRQERGLDVR